MEKVRSAPGMRERSPGVWELVVSAGRDVVTGKQRQVSRTFRGNLRDAKNARAELLTEVSKGRHTGTRVTVDDLFADWIVELARKGRSPNTIHGYERVYRHDIQPTLGSMPVTKVLTKTLTDLYGEHQRRGLSARSVYQIHACLSSMFTQACQWGWRDSNPAQWAEPPPIPNIAPEVPTPQDIRALIDEAERGKRPEMARAILVAATTGLRRAELCALRRWRDVDLERGLLRVSASIVNLPGQPVGEIPTKNRRVRVLAIDELTAAILLAQMDQVDHMKNCSDRGRWVRGRLLLLVALGAGATFVGAGAAEATIFERFEYAETFEQAFDLCGIDVDYVGEISGKGHIRQGRGRQAGAFFAQNNYSDVETFTNPDNGKFFTVSRDGIVKDIKATPAGEDLFEFVAHEAGQPFVVRNMHGNVLLRDRGLISYTVLFDTGGDELPGGDIIEELAIRVSGPHPGFFFEDGEECPTVVAVTLSARSSAGVHNVISYRNPNRLTASRASASVSIAHSMIRRSDVSG